LQGKHVFGEIRLNQTASLSAIMGVALMALGMMLIPVGDAIAKHIAAVAPHAPPFLAWSRFVIGVAVIGPVCLWAGAFRGLGRFFLLSQLVRGVAITGAILFMITAVGKASLADVFGAFFIGPVVSTLLARFVLREEVRRREWAALALGFVGVALVARPGIEMSEGLVWALAGGVSYGAYQAATRWTAGSAPPLAQNFAQMAVGTAILAPFGAPDLVAHGVEAGGWVIAMALSSLTANLLTILAYHHARAGVLAPIIYLQILSATGLGWVAFGDLPDLVGAIGLAVICSSALVLIRRQGARPQPR
jgi:drug/metabolite transporter (DMT)-like permease